MGLLIGENLHHFLERQIAQKTGLHAIFAGEDVTEDEHALFVRIDYFDGFGTDTLINENCDIVQRRFGFLVKEFPSNGSGWCGFGSSKKCRTGKKKSD